MNDSTFDQALDALVAGRQPEQQDDLTRFVAGIYRKERDVNMPTHHRIQLASELGLGGAPIAISASVEGFGQEERSRGRSRHLTWLAVAAAIVLAMTGLFNWGLPNGDNDDRFLSVPSAIPTVQATPVAATSPNAEWLMPISPYDCAMIAPPVGTPESTHVVAQEFPARRDYPMQQARYSPPMEAWEAARQMHSCMNTVGVETFWSDRFMYERFTMPVVDTVGYEDLTADQILRGQVASDFYLNQLGVTAEATVLRYDIGEPEVAGLDPGTYPVINPDWIVQTADGRMVVLVTAMVVSDGELPLVTPDISQPGGMAWVLIKSDDGWQIDEYLPVCLGDEDACQKFWTQQPGWGRYVELRTSSASPVTITEASPAASPQAPITLLKPVTAEECQFPSVDVPWTSVQIPSQTTISAQDYGSLIAPTANDAEAAALAARQAASCTDLAAPTDFMTTSFAVRTLKDRSFHPLLPIQNEQTLENSKQVSAEFAAESDLTASDMTIVIGVESPESATVPPGDYPLPLAEFAVQFPAGRIGVPVVMASVNPVATSGSRSAATGLGMLYVMANEDGTWKLDDVLYLCIGKCDEYFQELESVSYILSWMRPISSEECAGNYGVLPTWEPPTIIAIGSRQYLACDGGRFALMTETFQVADTETALQLSAEIAERGDDKNNVNVKVYAGFVETPDLPEDPYPVFDPNNAIVLSDGRIAILQSEVTVTSATVPGPSQASQVVTRALVWQEVEDTWRLDMDAEVCLGDCDAFWAEQAATPNP